MRLFQFLKDFYTLFFVWLSCLTASFIVLKRVPLLFHRFALFIILLSLLETTGNIIGFIYNNNHFFFNILYALELTLLPYFFSKWLNNSIYNRIVPVFLVLFPAFVLLNTFLIQGFNTLQTYSYVLGGSLILLMCISYLWKLYTDDNARLIFYDPIFWFSLAYLVYFAVSVPFIGMLNYLLQTNRVFTTLYYEVIMDGTICLCNILLTIGLLCIKQATK